MTNVFILGLGEIGYSNAKYYLEKGCKVFGSDVSADARKKARAIGVHVEEKIGYINLDDIDVFSISVPTAVIYDAVEMLVKEHKILDLPKDYLFMVESTCVPGTCRRIWEELFEKKRGIAHVPQRYWAQDPYGRGVRRKRIIAASDDDTFIKGIKFLKDINMPTFPVYGLEVAELAKVAENAYRNVMISYAEELFGVCKELDIDFWAVKEAIETHQSIGYLLEPRDGVGGHCLPMAAEIMCDLSIFNDIISAAIDADKKYRIFCRNQKGV